METETGRDSDSWVSVTGGHEDNSLDSSSSCCGGDNGNDTYSTDPTQHVPQHDTSAPEQQEDENDKNDGDDGDGDEDGSTNSSADFVIPTARPLSVDYDADVPPASGGGGAQRRRKGNQQHQHQQHQGDANQQPAQPPQQSPRTHVRRRTAQNSALTNPLYMFGAFAALAYLMRPDSSDISYVADMSSKFYDDPWDQGEEFRDRRPIPEELKRKRARAEKAAAAKLKKMKEEEEETRRKNATTTSGSGEVMNATSVQEKNVTGTSSETKMNITNATLAAEEADPFPQLYDWKVWSSRLANETAADDSFTDPIFLWFAPQSGGGSFVEILEDCYEDVNVTRGQWWQKNRSTTLNSGDGRFPIIATTDILEAASSAFSSSAKPGRCISLFMHPIERAIRSYHWHQSVSSRAIRSSNGTSIMVNNSNVTLAGYAQGPFAEENRLVRSIANRNRNESLRWEDLQGTMDFVSRKCLVGIISDKRSLLIRTIALIEFALGLNKRKHSKDAARCTMERIDEWVEEMHNISTKRIDLPSTDKGAWEALMGKNAYDMKMYEMGTELFANQTALLSESRGTSSEASKYGQSGKGGLTAKVNNTSNTTHVVTDDEDGRQAESLDIKDDDEIESIELDDDQVQNNASGDQSSNEDEEDMNGKRTEYPDVEDDDEIQTEGEDETDGDDQDQLDYQNDENTYIDNEDEASQE